MELSRRICENCTEDRAVVGSDLCEACEAVFDDNAFMNDMTVDEYARAVGVAVLPR